MMFSFSSRAVAKAAALFISTSLTLVAFGMEKAPDDKTTAPAPQQAPLIAPDPVKPLREKAQAGESEAQFQYGCCLLYKQGGVEKEDPFLGVEYLDRAAQAGYTPAAAVLGYEYQVGRILESSPEKMLHYYEMAANQGNAESLYELGSIYALGGKGIQTDKEKSFHYYEKALPLIQKEAEQELSRPYSEKHPLISCITLGNMYLEGKGTKIDQKEAFSWYLKAATKGDPSAQKQVSQCYTNGTGTQQNPQEAKKWLERSNKTNDPNTSLNLALLTLQGEGKSAAEKQFEEVARKGDARLNAIVGTIFREIYHNPAKAFLCIRQAAEAGDPDAQCALGVAYWKADGTSWNPVQAVKWLRKAIAGGQQEASQNLSTIIQYMAACSIIGLGIIIGAIILLFRFKKKRNEQIRKEKEEQKGK